jgi:hypothetical protein
MQQDLNPAGPNIQSWQMRQKIIPSQKTHQNEIIDYPFNIVGKR